MINALKGYKTYIIAFLMFAIGLVNFLVGDTTVQDLLNSPDLYLMLNGLGLGAMRAAMAKIRA